MSARPKPGKLAIVAALLTVYIVWGSTYLAILFAIESLPPFLMGSIRFILAGFILYGVLRISGHPAPDRAEWMAAAIVGILLLGFGTGGVSWAEKRIPSGVAALIVAGTPAWMVLLDWARPGGVRPGVRVLAGVALGMGGIGLLVTSAGDLRAAPIDPLGAAVVMLASLAWAAGSIVSRSIRVPRSAALFTAMQMIVAGFTLGMAGLVAGEFQSIELDAVTRQSMLAVGYLIVFGSWIGFSAYIWLLKSTTAAIASTYAYVNPGVAVLLGWAFAGERVGQGTFLAMAVIIVGVMMITIRPGRSPRVVASSGGEGDLGKGVSARAG
jgi:drug/metabolite transporter (DMT)-like permease